MSEGCCGKKDEKFDLMEKNSKKISFFVERVFLIKNDVRNPKKMVSMLYDDDFGSKMAFFEDFVKCFFFNKNQQNRKIQRSASILAIHKQKWANKARFMSSNECS